jgi:eukaryotic translation initiation factor 2C
LNLGNIHAFLIYLVQVCASRDPKGFMCKIEIRLQTPKVEIIQDLEAIIEKQLRYFRYKTNQKPDRIIFYRDGVGDGQFPEVCFKIQ